MLPTFLVIGTMKGGTTELYWRLSAHPDVFLTTPKEPHYFTREWERGREWYESLYADAGGALARGECSVSYTNYPIYEDTAQRVARTVPDVRLVYLVRDPADRIRSHYIQNVDEGRERRPCAQAALDALYVDRSRYAMQAERYLAHVGRDQLLVVRSRTTSPIRTWCCPASSNTSASTPPACPPRSRSTATPPRGGSSCRCGCGARCKGSARGRLYQLVPPQLRHTARRAASGALRRRSPLPEAVVTPELRARISAELAADQRRLAELLDEPQRQP